MTTSELFDEILSYIVFTIVFISLIFMASLSDAMDMALIGG